MTAIHTVSSAARAIGCSEFMVRHLDNIGVVKAVRNVHQHRQFTSADLEKMKQHIAANGKRLAHVESNVSEQVAEARRDGRFWPGGTIRLVASGQFSDGLGPPASVLVSYMRVDPDGRIYAAEGWTSIHTFTKPGTHQQNLPPGALRFDVTRPEVSTAEVTVKIERAVGE